MTSKPSLVTPETLPVGRAEPLVCMAMSVIPLFLSVRGVIEEHGGLFWVSLMMTFIFGLFAVAHLCQLIPGCFHLRICGEGLTIRRYWNDRFVPWKIIHEVRVVQVDEFAWKRTHIRDRIGLRIGGELNPSVESMGLVRVLGDGTGFNARLPDNYGQNPRALSLRLEQLRLKVNQRNRHT